MSFSLAGLFGCSKPVTPASVAKGAAPSTVTQSKIRDLGVVELTNHYETCVPIGAGQDCRMLPNLVGRRDLQLTLTLESKNANGQTSGLTIVQVSGSPEKPVEVSIGKTDFTFTPQVASE